MHTKDGFTENNKPHLNYILTWVTNLAEFQKKKEIIWKNKKNSVFSKCKNVKEQISLGTFQISETKNGFMDDRDCDDDYLKLPCSIKCASVYISMNDWNIIKLQYNTIHCDASIFH